LFLRFVTPARDSAHASSQGLHASSNEGSSNALRLNKFVRRLHDMLHEEKDRGVVEWRRGLLVLQNTEHFAKTLLPRYFNTRNFKTFRRQLNYYGFVHVRSFSTIGSATTALWVNRELAQITDNNDIGSVLLLKRVEPCESAKTVEGRRVRKELAMSTVDDELFAPPRKPLVAAAPQDVSTCNESNDVHKNFETDTKVSHNQVPLEIVCPPMPTLWDCAQLVSSQCASDFDHSHIQSVSNISRRASCQTTETEETIGVVTQASNDYSSNTEDEDDSTCAANLLLMLSKNAESYRVIC
jgi:HSF-type DNA-binding